MQKLLEVLEKTVRPQTRPTALAVRPDIPEVRVRLRDKQLAVCQQVAYSRYYGWSTLATAQSSHCVLGAACAGLIEVPERVRKGEVNHGVYQQTAEAAQSMQASMPRLEHGVQSVLSWPLERPLEGIDPDVVVLYLNSAQSMRLVQAFLYRQGGEFPMASSGDAGVCSRGLAQVIRDDRPVIEIPCLGDRRFAMTQDHELIVAFPARMIDEVIEGLEATHKAGIRYPIPFQIPEACHLPEPFVCQPDDH